MQPIKPMGRAVASRITSMGARCTAAEASCRPTDSADRTSTRAGKELVTASATGLLVVAVLTVVTIATVTGFPDPALFPILGLPT
jgi:hypothetical protein